MRQLARALYPATLAEDTTLAATAAAAEHSALSHGLRLVLLEQEAILRSALAARSAPRRGWLPPGYSSRVPRSAGTSTE